MKKQIIALYLPSLIGGGAERVMFMLANAFASRGYRVDLVLAKAEGPYVSDVSEQVRIVDLGASRVIASLPGLMRYLREERPVAVLSAMGHANVVAVVARALARVSARVVVSEHAHFSSSQANASSVVRSRAMGSMMRWAYPRADGIVAVSKGVADDLASAIGVPRAGIEVVYNPVATDDLGALSQQEPDHAWLAPDGPPVVLGVGRLTAQKDFSTLIHAFARVRAGREARLMILGDGNRRQELEALIKRLGLVNCVSLPGFVTNPYAYARRAALFVLSSRWEGFGNVLVEAMACGTPVVSTDCPSGPAEILEDGVWGRLVPVGDAEALAKAMEATLEEPEHPDVVKRAAAFDVDQAVDGYLGALLAGAGPTLPKSGPPG